MGRRFLASFTKSLSFTRRTSLPSSPTPPPKQEISSAAASSAATKFETDLAERLHLLCGSSPHLNWLSDALAILLSSASSLLRRPSSSAASSHLPLLIDASRALSRASLSLLNHLSRLESALLRSLSLPSSASAASRRLSAATQDLSPTWLADLDQAARSLFLLRKQLKAQRSKSATSAHHHQNPLANDFRGAVLSAALLLGAATVTLSRLAESAPCSNKSRSLLYRRLLDQVGGSIGAAWEAPLRQLQRELQAAAAAAAAAQQSEEGLDRLHGRMGKMALEMKEGRRSMAEIGNLRKEVAEMRGSMAAVHGQSSSLSRALVDLQVSLLAH